MLKSNDHAALLKLAEKAARRAGALLEKASVELRQIDQEMAHDIKIKADREAERCIVDILCAETDFSILSEEAGAIIRVDEGPRWIVDPLDGTLNFLRHIPIACVSIGLWDGDSPVLGVVFDFNRDELFKGQVGTGAWLNSSSIHVSDVKEKQKAILFTGFPAQADLTESALADFVSNAGEYRKVRWIGSAALSLAYVACGRGDVYEENGIKLWDIAGALPILVAAQGAYCMRKGKEAGSYHILAGNGLVPDLGKI